MNKQLINITLSIFLLLISTQIRAVTYLYNADVKGMVCAFCAYNVSKNISMLPGVDADSVDVDLESGHVAFYSSETVNEDKLVALFAGSGFTISNLKKNSLSTKNNKSENSTPLLILEIKSENLEQYDSVIEAVGNMAANTPSRLLVTASTDYEDKLLKPLLMGRQQVIKVRFVADDFEMVRLQLFADTALTQTEQQKKHVE